MGWKALLAMGWKAPTTLILMADAAIFCFCMHFHHVQEKRRAQEDTSSPNRRWALARHLHEPCEEAWWSCCLCIRAILQVGGQPGCERSGPGRQPAPSGRVVESEPNPGVQVFQLEGLLHPSPERVSWDQGEMASIRARRGSEATVWWYPGHVQPCQEDQQRQEQTCWSMQEAHFFPSGEARGHQRASKPKKGARRKAKPPSAHTQQGKAKEEECPA